MKDVTPPQFTFQTITMNDLDEILAIQKEAAIELEPGILQPLSPEEYISILRGAGIMLGAFSNEKLVAFRALLTPEVDEEHLGYDAGLSEDELDRVIYSEVSIVAPSYRGYGLQKSLGEKIFTFIDTTQFSYVCATVSPVNIASMKDKFSLQMEIAALKEKYGGKLRYVFIRNLQVGQIPRSESVLCPLAAIEEQQRLLSDGWRGVSLRQENGTWMVEYQR